jgi:phenol hydroxylase P3 protein
MDWLSAKYPTPSTSTTARAGSTSRRGGAGTPFKNYGLAMLCQTCQMPMVFTEPDDPTLICHREVHYKGDKYHFCSDGCKDIFENEPEKYVQAWLPMPQLFQAPAKGDLGAWMDWVSAQGRPGQRRLRRLRGPEELRSLARHGDHQPVTA